MSLSRFEKVSNVSGIAPLESLNSVKMKQQAPRASECIYFGNNILVQKL